METLPHLRLLVIDDDPVDVEVLLLELSQSFELLAAERVDTEDGMRAALDRDWDLVLVDWFLPRFSAPDALRVLEERGRRLPCIVVSGLAGDEVAVAAIRSGARNFVKKGELARLTAAIVRELAPQ